MKTSMSPERQRELEDVTKVFEKGILDQADINGVFVLIAGIAPNKEGLQVQQFVSYGGSAGFKAMLPELLEEAQERVHQQNGEDPFASIAEMALDIMRGKPH